jgi:hypothetical protein
VTLPAQYHSRKSFERDRKRLTKGIVGAQYLTPLELCLEDPSVVQRTEDKCEHKDQGQWLVEHEGKLFAILPAHNFQKSIWLGRAIEAIGEEKAVSMLRWFCGVCSTCQKP